MTGFTLRSATQEDARLLWDWSNDPIVRANAFHSAPIPWETHLEWFAQKLVSAGCRILILEKEDQAVGQIRFDRDGDYAEIDFSVASNFRGRGLGTMLLELSTPIACRELRVDTLIGIVKQRNEFSMRAFEKAGFRRKETFARNNEVCVRFEHTCRNGKE